MKNRIATPPDELIDTLAPPATRHEGNDPPAACDDVNSYLLFQKRILTYVLTLAAVCGGVLFLLGFASEAKGFVLGALFSALNFFLMATFLPMRLGHGQSRSTAISLLSICLRLSLLAIPLILAVKLNQFSLVPTIVGLFMVQAVILVDQIWRQSQMHDRK